METVETFKAEILDLESKQVIRKNFLSGYCDSLDSDKEFDLKDCIAENFDVEFNEIVIVGSAKLGFSIAPDKRYRAFNDNSDIDVAIISSKLYSTVWEEIYLYKRSGAYWPNNKEFHKYLNQGWMRPDKLPKENSFEFSTKWWDFFNEITSSRKFGPYKISGGVYHSWFFFFQYQYKCIEQCKLAIQNENICN